MFTTVYRAAVCSADIWNSQGAQCINQVCPYDANCHGVASILQVESTTSSIDLPGHFAIYGGEDVRNQIHDLQQQLAAVRKDLHAAQERGDGYKALAKEYKSQYEAAIQRADDLALKLEDQAHCNRELVEERCKCKKEVLHYRHLWEEVQRGLHPASKENVTILKVQEGESTTDPD